MPAHRRLLSALILSAAARPQLGLLIAIGELTTGRQSNETRTFQFDPADRLRSAEAPATPLAIGVGGSQEAGFVYDALGRLVAQTSGKILELVVAGDG